MQVRHVPIRDININAKRFYDEVKDTKQPILITKRDKPQVAVISLEDFEELRSIRMRKGLEELQHLAHQIAEEHKDNPLPRDMSVNHNTYVAEAAEKDVECTHTHYDNNR